MIGRALQYLFFLLVVHPIVLIVIGLNVRNRERLPKKGPAIIAANHNSHLDTVVLMSLYPLRYVHRLRPLAAADYFLRTPFLAWFSQTIIGIVPVDRQRKDRAVDPLAGAEAVLKADEILIMFPEGSRGEPGQLSAFKNGIARLAERQQDVPIIPVFLSGLDKILPKGDFLPVPFFCEVNVGTPMRWQGNQKEFMDAFTKEMETLAVEMANIGK